MIADTAANTREGVIHLDHAQGIIPACLPDQGNIALGALPSWTGIPAGSDAAFLYRICIGYSLWVEFECRTALGETFVEFVRNDDRADIGAVAASHAAVNIDIARFVLHADVKISSLPLYFKDFAAGHHFDVWVAADFDQLG